MKIVLADKKGIQAAAAVIRRGGVVAFPTDTAYGLGGLFNSAKAVSRILKIKNRRDRKFTLIAADLTQVRRWFKLKPAELKLVKKYWPGPLSLVVSPRYAVRVPQSSIARKLAALAGRPLIATSANRHGQSEQYSAAGVKREFTGRKYQPDLIVNGGRLARRRPSTVVKVVRGQAVVLRAGAVRLPIADFRL